MMFTLETKFKALRIISTVPSITELLSDLGLNDEVVGITKFCVHPETWFRTKTRIGGTKTLDIDKIRGLSPNLVIANKEENVRDQIEEISLFSEVLVTDIKTPEDNLDLITQIGNLTRQESAASKLRSKLNAAIESITFPNNKSTAYLIWKDPYMTIGSDTYIHAVMKKCGLRNIYGDKTRYPETTLQQLKKLQPSNVLLSSEPYPFKEKHLKEIAASIPNSKVSLVDGEAFSWYGTRLIKTAPYLTELITTINEA